MRLLLVALLCLGICAPASARLWESIAQMEQRFGPSEKNVEAQSPLGGVSGCELRKFERNGLICFAEFLNDKSVSEVYYREDVKQLSDAEMKVLLDLNSFGKEWHMLTGRDGTRSAIKEDRSASFICLRGNASSPIEYAVFQVPLFEQAEQADAKHKAELKANNLSFLSVAPSPTLPAQTARPFPSVPPVVDFAKAVSSSQRAAVMKHPDLGVAGSRLNREFLSRLAIWQTSHDPRLQQYDWPERLADECAGLP